MKIQQVKLKDNGMKGLEIIHLVQEKKDGDIFLVPTTIEPPYPIHRELENKIKDLRIHLLNICDMAQRGQDDMLYAIQDTDIRSFDVNADSFKIKGVRKMGDKILKVETYLVAAEDYDGFADVKTIIGGILEEVREYAKGNRQISMDELGERFIENLIRKGKKTEFTVDEFQAMSAEAKKEFCKKHLEEECGMISATFEEDLVDDGEDNVVEFNANTGS